VSEMIFVPLTDELLYEHPEQITGPLLPYHIEWPCHHWLAVELNPEDDEAPRVRAAGAR